MNRLQLLLMMSLSLLDNRLLLMDLHRLVNSLHLGRTYLLDRQMGFLLGHMLNRCSRMVDKTHDGLVLSKIVQGRWVYDPGSIGGSYDA